MTFLRDRCAHFLLLLALALRLPRMFDCLWYDEISSTRRYLEDIYHLWEASTFETNMPMHFILMFFWNKLAPDTDFSLRVLPLFFGLASLVLSYELADRFFGRVTARWTLLLLALAIVRRGVFRRTPAPQVPSRRRPLP